MAEKDVILPISRERDVAQRIPGVADKRRRPTISGGVQATRLGPKLDEAFKDILDRSDIDVQQDPSALAPERVLVFEIIGSPVNFVTAAKKVGLEWLAEEVATLTGVNEYFDVSGRADPDDEEDDIDGDVALAASTALAISDTPGSFYLGMPTIETFDKLRRLWDRFKANKKAPENHTDWWKLFGSLHDLRSWGPQDRLTNATRERLREQIEDADGDVRIEIDLWFREEGLDRDEAKTELEEKIESLGGTVIDELRVREIRYHAALVELSPEVIRELLDAGNELLTANEVMSIRPQAAFRFGIDEPAPITDEPPERETTRDGAAIAALIDGYPIENHDLLKDRIDVIPVDVFDSMAPVETRYHGTSMASLILHGDLHADSPTIGRTLKIVPVLASNEHGHETPPADQLAVRTIMRAVHELKEGDDPSGEDVVIINHSICDEATAFCGVMSHWARLLDHLSYKHKVLFVVSAGNIEQGFALSDYSSIPGFRTAAADERRKAILMAIEAGKSQRGILAPAEAVNCLTVGAVHHDASTEILPANNVDPYGAFRMVNLNSGLGLGFNRAIKPDVVFPGGRQIAHPTLSDGALSLNGRPANGIFGQRAAAPDEYGGKTSLTRLSAGTSNAAAMATRSGILIADALDDAYEGAETPWYKRPTAPAVLKALISHSAQWGDVGEHLDEIYPPAGKHTRRRENVARFLGYGQSDMDRIISGGQHRVTFLAEDVIRQKQRHTYRIPLPDELASKTEFRRITTTLAWLSPIKPHSANYRAVGLELVGSDGLSKIWTGVSRIKSQPAVSTAKKGTLIHAVYENEGSAVAFLDGSDFILNVQAYSRLSGFTKADVPYALAVTIEVATAISTDIRTPIRDRIGNRIGIRNG